MPVLLLQIVNIAGLLTLLGISLGIVIYYLISFYLVIRFWGYYAPYVPSPNTSLIPLATQIVLKDTDVCVEVGCGDGRFLALMAKNYPLATCIGLEINLFPYVRAKIRCLRLKNMRVYRQNMFTYDFSKATVLYCYLFPETLTKLYPKLKKELPKGARLYSLDFPIKNLEPSKTLDLGQKHLRGKTLYMYEF